jgi:FkbM family methyltransferase
MTTILLNSLDQLPRGASLTIIGRKARNSRLIGVLHSLRPDLIIRWTIDMDSLISCRSGISEISAGEGSAHPLPSADYLLLTTCKSREHRQLSPVGTNWSGKVFVVNPNFYHPFCLAGEDHGMHAAELTRAQDLLFCKEDRSIYDLLLAAIEPKSDLKDIYFQLIKLSGRMGQQYFDFINPAPIRTILEGGVADGWTSVQLLEHFPEAIVYGFDPDSEALGNSFYMEFLSHCGRFHYKPFGLWDKRERLHFEVGEGCMGRIACEPDDQSINYIDTISIDRFVVSTDIQRVDFIKLDIEGAELHAVKGAKETIRRHRPQMAVCVYHQLEHYYRIPFLLDECCTDYIFRAGHYSPFHAFSETVWYAIPKEHFCGTYPAQGRAD